MNVQPPPASHTTPFLFPSSCCCRWPFRFADWMLLPPFFHLLWSLFVSELLCTACSRNHICLTTSHVFTPYSTVSHHHAMPSRSLGPQKQGSRCSHSLLQVRQAHCRLQSIADYLSWLNSCLGQQGRQQSETPPTIGYSPPGTLSQALPSHSSLWGRLGWVLNPTPWYWTPSLHTQLWNRSWSDQWHLGTVQSLHVLVPSVKELGRLSCSYS